MNGLNIETGQARTAHLHEGAHDKQWLSDHHSKGLIGGNPGRDDLSRLDCFNTLVSNYALLGQDFSAPWKSSRSDKTLKRFCDFQSPYNLWTFSP